MRALPLVVSVVLAAGLVTAYVAAGGTSYEPTPVASPCAPRPPHGATSTGERLEVVLLDAADAAACRLGVSREELVLALRGVDDLDRLAEEKGRSRDELEEALRDGLVRAVDRAEQEHLVGDSTAGALRFAAEHLPLGLLLEVLRGASSLLD